MNEIYSNDPRRIGQYRMNDAVLVNTNNRLNMLNPFDNSQKIESVQKNDMKIMEKKARTTVPEQSIPLGTKISKSCNLAGVQINRFENPHVNVQDPTHIIQDELFRGGAPSRIVMKDNYVKSRQQ